MLVRRKTRRIFIEEQKAEERKEGKNRYQQHQHQSLLPAEFQPLAWTKVTSSCKDFQYRSSSQSATFGKRCYVFGGWREHEGAVLYPSDVKMFDFETKAWSTRHATGEIPHGRISFSMCKGPYDQSFIISGGTTNEKVLGDMFEYNLLTSKWKKIQPDTSDSPCKSYGQSVCCYGDKLLFFGGSTGCCSTNATYEFHLSTQTWKMLATKGQIPSPRCYHTATIIGDFMIVTGGENKNIYQPTSKTGLLELFSLNLRTLKWSTLQTSGSRPSARLLNPTFRSQNDHLFVMGGSNDVQNNMVVICILEINSPNPTWQCLMLSDRGKGRDIRAFSTPCVYGGALWLLEGSEGAAHFNEIWQYKFTATPPSLQILSGIELLKSETLTRHKAIWKDLPRELLRQLFSQIETTARCNIDQSH